MRLLGLGREEVHRYRDQVRRGDRSAMPGAVRASAGINTTDDDVQRLLAAVARVAAEAPPVLPRNHDRHHSDRISDPAGPYLTAGRDGSALGL